MAERPSGNISKDFNVDNLDTSFKFFRGENSVTGQLLFDYTPAIALGHGKLVNLSKAACMALGLTEILARHGRGKVCYIKAILFDHS